MGMEGGSNEAYLNLNNAVIEKSKTEEQTSLGGLSLQVEMGEYEKKQVEIFALIYNLLINHDSKIINLNRKSRANR